MQRVPYLCDPKLIPRVQKYLEANVDKTYVDIGSMADELQNTYREYSRRKRNAFRASVKKAYSIVLRSYGLDQNYSSSEDEVEEAESENSKEDRPQDNVMNNQLVELYTRSAMNNPKINDNELIDISSDDSKEEDPLPKSSNGPSTSIRPTVSDFSNNSQVSIDRCEKITVIQGKKRKLDDRTSISIIRKKKAETASAVNSEVPRINLNDVVGVSDTLVSMIEKLACVINPLCESVLEKEKPRLEFLLHGPAGCGKTFLAHAIAGHLGLPLIKVNAPELVVGISGNSEKMIRDLFKRANSSAPCVLFIDKIDAITRTQMNQQKDMQKRIVSQLCLCLDDLNKDPSLRKVIFIGATNNPDSVDSELRTYGRFSNEIRLGIPNEESRIAILKKHSKVLTLQSDFNWNRIGAVTPGYVGADLEQLIYQADQNSKRRFFQQMRDQMSVSKISGTNENGNAEKKDLDKSEPEIIVDDDPKEIINEKTTSDENLVLVIEDENSKQEEDISSSTVPLEAKSPEQAISGEEIEKTNCVVNDLPKQDVSSKKWTWEEYIDIIAATKFNISDHLVCTEDDFLQATKQMTPSLIKEGLVSIPSVTWDDIGSLKDIRSELRITLLGTTEYRKHFEIMNLNIPAGVLLCGPPGCGKTLVAQALANEARINFISVKGPELLNMYVGESERAVRMCFQRAKNSAPCIIFFDEIDALCPKRSGQGENNVSARVVNQLLTEMAGVEERKGVFILAATNRPDVVDPAILRPGRLDKILYVGLPSPDDRVEILKTITKNGEKYRLAKDVDLELIGRSDRLKGYTGADLSGLLQEAARIYIHRMIVNNELENCDHTLTVEDFEKAISKITPSVSEKDMELYEEMKEKYSISPTDKIDMDVC